MMRYICSFTGDGNLIGRYPTGSSGYSMHSDDAASVDVEIKCTYFEEISIDFWECDEYDGNTNPDSKDDHIGWVYINRGDEWDDDNSGSRTVIRDDDPGEYKIDFRIITDPIPTVRLLGVYCEAQSAGMNTDLVEAIASVAEECTKAAGKVLKKSPRPSRKLMGDAFIAASKVLKGIVEFAELIAHLIEGDDDFYMRHIAETETRGVGGSFFPPDQEVYKMSEGTEIHFEEEYGKYFRFPLDTGPVTIELREYDTLKYDVIVGSIIVDPEQISNNTNDGISGGSPPPYSGEDVESIEGGAALFDGPAVVEIANSYYGRHDGEGAVYHICYSVGMEDWCLPATTEGQADPDDEEETVEVHGYFTTPRGPVDLTSAIGGCEDQNGVLPSVEEMSALIDQGLIPDSWPAANFWLADNYYIDIKTGIFNGAQEGSEACFYSCKQTDREDGVEGWDGVYGFTFTSPSLEPVNYDSASEGCAQQGGQLPPVETLQQLVEDGRIPTNWPVLYPYWANGNTYINITDGTITQSADGSESCYYTCQIIEEEDRIESWDGVRGLFTSPSLEPLNYDATNEGCTNQGGELPAVEGLQQLIEDGRIPESWPIGSFWVKGGYYIDITNGSVTQSADGSELCYYTCQIIEEEDRVEGWDGVHGLFKSPKGETDYASANQECIDQGGQLPAVEELQQLMEQGQVPESWPVGPLWAKGAYYINITDGTIMQSTDGSEPFYYTCIITGEEDYVEEWDGVHGLFMSPMAQSDYASANQKCLDQGGELPTAEELQLLIENGRIPDSWPVGPFWVSDNNYVNITDGEVISSTDGTERCFCTCMITGGTDHVEEWEGVHGLFTAPQGQVDYNAAVNDCGTQGGGLPTEEELRILIENGQVPASWPNDNFWMKDGYYMNITDSFYTKRSGDGSERCFFTCKITDGADDVEEWDGLHGYFYAPDGWVSSDDATGLCQARGGRFPSAEELQQLIEEGRIPVSWPTVRPYWVSGDAYVDITDGTLTQSADGSEMCYFTCMLTGERDHVEDWKGVDGCFTAPDGMMEYTAATGRCQDEGGRLPEAEELQELIALGMIPDSWPTGDYWVNGSILINITDGTATQSENGAELSYYTCMITGQENQVEEWEGIGGLYTFPLRPVNETSAADGAAFQGGEFPTIEQLRLLIDQEMIPDSWPTNACYWTADNRWVDITDIYNDGTSADGLESFYYTSLITGVPNGVEACEGIEEAECYYAPPSEQLSHAQATDICQVRRGELPTLEALLLLIEQNQIPDSWPKDAYYYTTERYMVNINPMGSSDDIVMSGGGDQFCYYTCELEPEGVQEVHGFFTAPQYVVDFDAANRGCVEQGGALPALEELLLLIEQGRIPSSWPKGDYWAGASANTPFRVNIEDGSYTYSTTGSLLCYYSCKISGEADGMAEWEPGGGYFTFPPTKRLDLEGATAACQEMGGELPSFGEMQNLIREGWIPSTWPTDRWYITSDNRLVDITDWEFVGTPETTYYYTCKLSGDRNGIETGDEVESEGRLYTHPQGPADYAHAVDGSFYQGGVLPNLEELRLMVEQELIPDTWPKDGRYYTSDKYMVYVDSIYSKVGAPSNNGSEQCYYTCKIEQEPADQEVHGFFKSPLLQAISTDLDNYLAILGGVLPTLEELLLLIEQGRIPDTWPTDCSYWAGTSKETLFKVDIKTGAYYFEDDYYGDEEGSYYTCKIEGEGEADGMEEWVGVDGFYMLPGESSSDYATARQACIDQGGKLPSVEKLQKLIRQGKVPESWPAGYYWTSGSYYMNIADGTFKYSLSGSESCHYTCRMPGANGLAQGDEVEVDGVLYLSPEGLVKPNGARDLCDYQGGELPTLEEMQYLIDEGLVPDTWPTNSLYLAVGYGVDITDSTNIDQDSDGIIVGYYTCKVVLGQQEEDPS